MKYKIFVSGAMYEDIIDKYDILCAKYYSLIKRERKTRNLLYKAQEIMTRLRNRQHQIYSCDCGRMNKSVINSFFSDVTSLKKTKLKGE